MSAGSDGAARAAALLSDREVAIKLAALERRRPGAPVPSVGVRPHRRPWTYRQIWEFAALQAEDARRRHPSESDRAT